MNGPDPSIETPGRFPLSHKGRETGFGMYKG